jgi:thiol-disulfide isomerase/thioredoxin
MSSIVELLPNRDFTDSGRLKNYKEKIVLIKFYTNWCGYCKRAIPEYEKLADEYKRNKNVVIAKIDADKSENLMHILNNMRNGPKILGYPTIVLFNNNLYKDTFNDERKVQAYKEFINKSLNKKK